MLMYRHSTLFFIIITTVKEILDLKKNTVVAIGMNKQIYNFL